MVLKVKNSVTMFWAYVKRVEKMTSSAFKQGKMREKKGKQREVGEQSEKVCI